MSEASKDSAKQETPAETKAPELRSLSPRYEPAEHEVYVEILKAELVKTGDDAPRNIALTGHYGSGKSSVLIEVAKQLRASKVKVINLSLPSLGIGDGRIVDGKNAELERTNLIQKEIVKLLLYRRSPKETPASRYSRLDEFDPKTAKRRAVILALVAAMLALLWKLPSKVHASFPNRFWSWINAHLWWNFATPIQWVSLLVVFVLALLTASWAQRVLQRLRVTELTAGPTKVTLSEGSTSFFDEYLDEIVYFFQTSKTSVVIFEDLDRFKAPHIFETLRELNLLLNNADQTGSTPIRFVYAIRDSIFEVLDDASEDDDSGDGEGVRDTNEDALPPAEREAETRRLMSTNRTKFFDLLVPIVPFISHRTSRELIRDELRQIETQEQRPSSEVISIVSAHLTDMRLIKNICNEFDVFRGRILAADGLTELTADRLFASIVYKNLYLGDYEAIRHGDSRLDTLYRAYRNWVSRQATDARARERTARMNLRQMDAVAARSARLGSRLATLIRGVYGPLARPSSLQLTVNGEAKSWEELQTAAFWRDYVEGQPEAVLTYSSANGYPTTPVTLSFDLVGTWLGDVLDAAAWEERDRAQFESAVAAATDEQRRMIHATMAEALAESERTFDYEGQQASLSQVAEELFEGADIVLDLLRAGHIDENFTLYATEFPGQGSAAAMNYVMKSVQRNEADFDYHFGAKDAPPVTADIDAVIEAEGQRLLAGQSVYNREIFDHLLATDPSKLNQAIMNLARNADEMQEFVDAYIADGTQTAIFIGLLSQRWSGLLDRLLGEQPDLADPDLLNAAIANVNPTLDYDLSESQRGYLESVLRTLACVTTAQSPTRAREMATSLARMDVRTADLSTAVQPLLGELISRDLYRVTLKNLLVILGEITHVALDAVKREHADDVYPYVLSHLVEYLSVIDEASEKATGDATAIVTVAQPDDFTEVLADVGKADRGQVQAVARRAASECEVDDLSELDSSLWPSIATAHRLVLTSQTVSDYVNELGVDDALAEWLSSARVITAAEPTQALTLAVELLNDEHEGLDTDTKLALVKSLNLNSASIQPAQLEGNARAALPGLVKQGVVEDDADAFKSLTKDETKTKAALIRESDNFADYMFTAPLDANDLWVIANEDVPDAIRKALFDRVDEFQGVLKERAARSLINWAVSEGHRPTSAGLVTLVSCAGSEVPTAESISLLGDQAVSIDRESLLQVLNALGDPYDKLTAVGQERPTIPVGSGVEPILERLRGEGIVSQYRERRGAYRVSKRHT